MNTKRVERLLKIIQTLESRRTSTVEELSEIVGVSRRTVFRDLKILERSGITYEFDRANKQYSASRSTMLPPVTLTHSEALSILIATRLMLNHPAAMDTSAATSAGIKIESMLPAPMIDELDPMLDRLETRFTPSSDVKPILDTLRLLQSVLMDQKKIKVHYDSYYKDERKIDVTMHPYRLAYIHRGWYLIAFSEKHDEVRTFKLERMLQIKLLEDEYTIDPAFTLDNYFDHAWLMIKGDQRFHVKVRFSPMVAANVDEVRWHKTQRALYESDGSLLFEVDVDGLAEISWWLLGYGGEAEVLEPPELITALTKQVSKMRALYPEDETPNS